MLCSTVWQRSKYICFDARQLGRDNCWSFILLTRLVYPSRLWYNENCESNRGTHDRQAVWKTDLRLTPSNAVLFLSKALELCLILIMRYKSSSHLSRFHQIVRCRRPEARLLHSSYTPRGSAPNRSGISAQMVAQETSMFRQCKTSRFVVSLP